MTLPNGLTTSYAFDNANRLTRLSHTTGGGSVTLGDYQFAVDAVGNRTAITETVQVPGMGGARRVVTYTQQLLLPFVGNQAQPAQPTITTTQYPILLPFLSNGGVGPSQTGATPLPIRPVQRAPGQVPTVALPTPNSAATKAATPSQGRVPTRALVPAQTATPTDKLRVGGLPNLREEERGVAAAMDGITETTTISYSYDPLYRVTGATYTGGLTNSYGYAYDAVGNRTVQTQTITSTVVITYGYDIANRLTNVNGQPYTWDDNGNLVNDGAQAYVYDQANRLKQVVQGAITTTFAYNGAGDRLSQTVGVTTTHYVLDPAAGLTQVLADGTNTYLYGNSRLAQYQTAMQYFGADGLGSVRQIFDASGQVVGSTRYDPYGNVMSQSGTATSVFAFAGEQQDATGLEYLRARYYSSAQGRFTTRDVWEGEYMRPLSLNRWNYVQANPVNFDDPTGLDLMLVGGFNTDDWNQGPTGWKPWVMTYKNWNDDEWNAFFDLWTSSDDPSKDLLMRLTKVHVFNWNVSNMAGPGQISANVTPVGWAVNALYNAMADMEDITLLGHSKGGNLVLNFLKYDDFPWSGSNVLKNAVIIAAPASNFGQGVLGMFGCEYTSRDIPGRVLARTKVVNIYNLFDPISQWGGGPISGAINHEDRSAGVHSLLGDWAGTVLNGDLHVESDCGARDDSGAKLMELDKNGKVEWNGLTIVLTSR